MKSRSRTERWPRRVAWGGLTLAVVALHGLALDTWSPAGAFTGGRAQPDAHVSVRVVSVPPVLTRAAAVMVPTPAARPSSSRPPPAPRPAPDAPPSPFLHADRLDRRPTPVSAPDARWLDTLASQPISGLPLRLRLFITAAGDVVAVEPIEVSELDVFALPALEAMFRDTAFLPGRHQGRDVASQIELELHLDGAGP
ncbi:hypothetical protein [Sphaerotilus sp.]|uniref:hypothetical protein n=1 Tax=Sphaerotilus sp. TaxID=2093942 RepID=UPI002ACDFF75|nr:hypothetical protein [Sphaerotilus sp.]MDZ7856163.1 hypothetical protein [Sphaerotilus sp.]